jgi:DHA2 family multidrug resistance protein
VEVATRPNEHPADPQAEPERGRGLQHKWKVLICVVFGIFMVILDTTVVNVAFPTLRAEYGASLAAAQWIVSVYVLALGISTPLAGFLADRFGIKRMYAFGLGLFVAGSVLSGIAPSLGFLVVARAIQATGGGIAVPLGTAILYSTFPPSEQGMALGYFGVALLTAPALGPILGGVLVDAGAWRWIFFINVPVGLTGVFLARRWLRERRAERSARIDIPGLALSCVAFGALLYAASTAAARGWTAAPVLAWFGVGAAALAGFVAVELFVAADPLLDFRLFGDRTFLLATLIGWVTVLALFGAEFLMPVYLQSLRGKTALETGVILLPLAVTAAIATPLAGRLYDRIGPRVLVLFGFSVLLVNTWQLSQIEADTSTGYIAFLMSLRGLALGCTVQTTFATALGTVPPMRLARGSSLINATRYVVQSIGVAVLATVLASSVSPQVRALEQRIEGNPQALHGGGYSLCRPAAEAAIPLTNAAPRPSAALLDRACDEQLLGFERAYRLTFWIALVAIAIGAFLPGWPGAWSGRGQGGARAAPAH